MKSIYIVSTGLYSDYQIVAVFSEIGNAFRYCEVRNGASPDHYDSFRIEEFPIDNAAMAPPAWKVRKHRSSNKNRCFIKLESIESLIGDEEFNVVNSDEIYKGNMYSVTVRAKDVDHAKKIGLDMIGMKEAEEAGL